jgi:hypothetical protein
MAIRDAVLARHAGPVTVVTLTVAYAAFWVVLRPAGEPGGAYVGQLVGAISILLLSGALVLISSLPWVEEWFDGIDRAAIWHRRMAITGLVLLAAGEPQGGGPPSGCSDGPPAAPGGRFSRSRPARWAPVPRKCRYKFVVAMDS